MQQLYNSLEVWAQRMLCATDHRTETEIWWQERNGGARRLPPLHPRVRHSYQYLPAVFNNSSLQTLTLYYLAFSVALYNVFQSASCFFLSSLKQPCKLSQYYPIFWRGGWAKAGREGLANVQLVCLWQRQESNWGLLIQN